VDDLLNIATPSQLDDVFATTTEHGFNMASEVKKSFDFIFADAWDGKFFHLQETINLLKKGGIYFIDDMLAQVKWPDGHQDKTNALNTTLEQRQDMQVVKMNWASGIIIGVKQ